MEEKELKKLAERMINQSYGQNIKRKQKKDKKENGSKRSK